MWQWKLKNQLKEKLMKESMVRHDTKTSQNVMLVGMSSKIIKMYTYKRVDGSTYNRVNDTKAKQVLAYTLVMILLCHELSTFFCVYTYC